MIYIIMISCVCYYIILPTHYFTWLFVWFVCLDHVYSLNALLSLHTLLSMFALNECY